MPAGNRSLPLFNKFLKSSFGVEYLDLHIDLIINEFLIFQFDKSFFINSLNLNSRVFLKRLYKFLSKTDSYLTFYLISNLIHLTFTELENRFIKNNVILYTKEYDYVDLELSISRLLDIDFLHDLKNILLDNLSFLCKEISSDVYIFIYTLPCDTCLNYDSSRPIHFTLSTVNKLNLNIENYFSDDERYLVFDNSYSYGK